MLKVERQGYNENNITRIWNPSRGDKDGDNNNIITKSSTILI